MPTSSRSSGAERAGRWQVHHRAGSAAAIHAADPPEPMSAQVWLVEVTAPALVLGSSQRALAATLERWSASQAEPIDIVVRRSGGGLVEVVPGRQVWVEVFVPSGDVLHRDDVGEAFDWLGDVWAEALAAVAPAPAGPFATHRGPVRRTDWSDRLCFAGLGRGEVTVGDRKLVGISQRRTRAGARFQCLALLEWSWQQTRAAFAAAGDPVPSAMVETVGIGLAEVVPGVDAADLTGELLAALARR